MSNMPTPYGGNFPVPMNGSVPLPAPRQMRRINKGLARYENAAFAATQRERIDQVCFMDGTMHSVGLSFMLVDQIGTMANGDAVKLQVGAEILANCVNTNNARMQKRWGGAR